MAAVLLLHSIRGLRDVERALAERMRAAGHLVLAPDLYEGERADDVEQGFAIEARIGRDRLVARAAEAAAELPPDAVLAGLSWGAFAASLLWPRRPETRGLLLLHGMGVPPAAPRPGTLVQVHLADPDPFEPEEDVAAWRDAAVAAGATVELFRYPGAGHLFLDPTLPDHDPAAAALALRRADAFLAAL